jgi:indolepyruvate decarboxylase
MKVAGRPAPRVRRLPRATGAAAPVVAPAKTVGQHLIRRLQEYGVGHVFGIPGDYVLGFYDQLSKGPLQVVGTIKEDGAGFAADAYARVRGMGAVCVTWCVGGLSLANAVAGAWAEQSPVVLISGAPGMRERRDDPLLHHRVKGFDSQRRIFAEITAMAVALEDPATACAQIDLALETCWRRKRPVYIELPRDVVDMPAVGVDGAGRGRGPEEDPSDPAALAEAVAEAMAALRKAKHPVILADVEVHRFGLADELARLAEASGIPVAVTILGKSVISEKHPYFLGVYEGAMGRQEVRTAVEAADCLLMLGTVPSDVNLGIFTAEIDRDRVVEANAEGIRVRRHGWDQVGFGDFLRALVRGPLRHRRLPPRRAPAAVPAVDASAPMAVTRLFALLNQRLQEDMAVVCDVGLCLFGAIDLEVHRGTEFLAPAYYTSMGFAVPAALGVGCAHPGLRPIVLVGDGAFQMTGMELSSIAKLGQAPIILVLNNRGYTTERFIMDGPYNDIVEWKYARLPEVLGHGTGHIAENEGEFVRAWEAAVADRSGFSLIEVRLPPMDPCPALQRLGASMARNLKR